jgi:Fic family protein
MSLDQGASVAKVLRRRWHSDLASGLSRRDRQSCDYDAYLPDLLSGRSFSLDGDVAADVADAEAAIRRLSETAHALADTEALARLLLRAEAVASSRIEGLEVGGRRLLRAEMASDIGDDARDVTAIEVLGNIEAMRWATDTLANAPRVEVSDICEIHRRLLTGTRHEQIAGVIRTKQNWIGGSSYNPCSAAFVPPPPDDVNRLMEDLCDFIDSQDLPAVVHAAVVHAQFETIHPFPDGNGRTGRALIHVVLRRRGLVERAGPPISLVLATEADRYVAGLTAYRYVGKAGSPEAIRGLNRWLATFASATRRASIDAVMFETHIADIQREWREALGRVRSKSATDLLIAALPGVPIVTVASAARLIGRTTQATNEAFKKLTAAGVLEQVNIGRHRNRAYEAPAIIDAFTAFERGLASPTGDTTSAPPVRTEPARPAG